MVIEAKGTIRVEFLSFLENLKKFCKVFGIDFDNSSVKISWMKCGSGLTFKRNNRQKRNQSDGIDILYESKKAKNGFTILDFAEYYSVCQEQLVGKIVANRTNNYIRYVPEKQIYVGESGTNLYKSLCICSDEKDLCQGVLNFLENPVCKL